MKTKIFKNYALILAIVKYRNWLDASPTFNILVVFFDTF